MHLIRAAFAGDHVGDEREKLSQKLKKRLSAVLDTADYAVFLLRPNDEFCKLVFEIVKDLKTEHPDYECCLILVLATPPSEKELDAYMREYDDTDYPEKNDLPLDLALASRDRYMIERSNALFCYITDSQSSTNDMRKYAESDKIDIIDLAAL